MMKYSPDLIQARVQAGLLEEGKVDLVAGLLGQNPGLQVLTRWGGSFETRPTSRYFCAPFAFSPRVASRRRLRSFFGKRSMA